MRWPVDSASARAIDTASVSPSTVRANAAGARRAHTSGSNRGQRQWRQVSAERADGRHLREARAGEEPGEHAARDHRDDHRRDARGEAARAQRHDDREGARGRGPGIDRGERGREPVKAREESGSGRDRDTEEVVQLRGDDQQRGAGGKPDHDGVRDEVDQRSQAREPHRELDRADQQAQREHEREVVGAAGQREGRDGREHDQRQRVGGPADEVPRRAPQRGDDGRHHRAIEAVLRRQAGERRVRHPLRQHDQRAHDPRLRVGGERRGGDAIAPGEERQEGDEPGRHAGAGAGESPMMRASRAFAQTFAAARGATGAPTGARRRRG